MERKTTSVAVTLDNVHLYMECDGLEFPPRATEIEHAIKDAMNSLTFRLGRYTVEANGGTVQYDAYVDQIAYEEKEDGQCEIKDLVTSEHYCGEVDVT